ncbi:hypothetical protein D1007_09207 [Hordeum vulgare]|nr:hypothetical protein D1007_09207 [Hordeum vulgare]
MVDPPQLAVMLRPSDPSPTLRWAASFSNTGLDGSPEWHDGSLYLDRPGICFLRDGDGKIVEGRHLRSNERIQRGSDMVLLDCVVHVGVRVYPDRPRLTLAPGALSSGARSPSISLSPSSSGSRFQTLADTDEEADENSNEGRLANEMVNTVLDDDVVGGRVDPMQEP